MRTLFFALLFAVSANAAPPVSGVYAFVSGTSSEGTTDFTKMGDDDCPSLRLMVIFENDSARVKSQTICRGRGKSHFSTCQVELETNGAWKGMVFKIPADLQGKASIGDTVYNAKDKSADGINRTCSATMGKGDYTLTLNKDKSISLTHLKTTFTLQPADENADVSAVAEDVLAAEKSAPAPAPAKK